MSSEDKRYFGLNDTAVAISATLTDADGAAIDLTGDSVKFQMNRINGTVKVDEAAAVIDNASTGQVSYQWAAGDVDEAGRYEGWFIRITSGGARETFPLANGSGTPQRLTVIIVDQGS